MYQGVPLDFKGFYPDSNDADEPVSVRDTKPNLRHYLWLFREGQKVEKSARDSGKGSWSLYAGLVCIYLKVKF